MKYVQAALPDDLGEWVDSIFHHGQKQAFVVECFSNLRKLMTEGTLPPPSEYARLSSLRAVERMARGDG